MIQPKCQIIKHKEGSHYSKRRLNIQAPFNDGTKHYSYRVHFPESATYPPIPTDPWNKLAGISFWPLTNSKKNTIMVSWRYRKPFFELSLYYHDPKGLTYGNHSEIHTVSIPPDTSLDFGFFINFKEKKVLSYIGDDYYEVSYPFIRPTSIHRTINPYFGGRVPAPNPISFNLCKYMVVPTYPPDNYDLVYKAGDNNEKGLVLETV